MYAALSEYFFSLRDVLEQRERPFILRQRFSIAKVLARAILYLHLSRWLQKAIRNDKMIFFARTAAEIDLGECYLVGFEHSRLDEATASTADAPDTECNIYCHPNYQGLHFEPDTDTAS
jgi:hypothetical protein